ncbi:hypothetical protein [Streptomyces sp. SM11]|uniref:hypothetical protein n=1 Tax=Streptomyces sp. SM11 TaxID=565557 RepID=UPI0011B00D12|nr:hypothetical protein [Streptomyces sp. SM11]
MNHPDQQPCTREDLRAVVLVESSWGVTSSGTVDVADYYGEGGGDTEYIDYYWCDYCDMTFEPEHGAQWPREQGAWKAALAHLEQPGTAA